jgi:uncharacterized protein YndB with AHSA1/START domain
MTTASARVSTTQVYQIVIRATPEQIWDAITHPEFTRQYFHGARVDTTGEAGTPIRYYSPEGTLWGDDKVLESDPPHRLVVTWRSLWDEELAAEPVSRVTWLIEARDAGACLLTVTHDQLDDSPKTAAAVSGEGWTFVLSGMKTLLETGAPMARSTSGS